MADAAAATLGDDSVASSTGVVADHPSELGATRDKPLENLGAPPDLDPSSTLEVDESRQEPNGWDSDDEHALDESVLATSTPESFVSLAAERTRLLYWAALQLHEVEPLAFAERAVVFLNGLLYAAEQHLLDVGVPAAERAALQEISCALRLQRDTWLLILALFGEPRSLVPTDDDDTPGDPAQATRRAPALDQVSRLASADGLGRLPWGLDELPGLGKCRRVVEWLERATALDIDHELGGPGLALAEVGDAWDPSYRWGYTAMRNGALDFDAPLRESATLLPEDERAEERICRAVFYLVRAGRLHAARALLRTVGQPWRAGALGGGAGVTAVARHGHLSASRVAWRKVTQANARNAALGNWERGIFAYLGGGDLQPVIGVCRGWSDQAWASFSLLVDSHIEAAAKMALAGENGEADAPPESAPMETATADVSDWPFEDVPDARIQHVFDALLPAAVGPNEHSVRRLQASMAVAPCACLPRIADECAEHDHVAAALRSAVFADGDVGEPAAAHHDSQWFPCFAAHLVILLRQLGERPESSDGMLPYGDEVVEAYVRQLAPECWGSKRLQRAVVGYASRIADPERLVQLMAEVLAESQRHPSATIMRLVGDALLRSRGDAMVVAVARRACDLTMRAFCMALGSATEPELDILFAQVQQALRNLWGTHCADYAGAAVRCNYLIRRLALAERLDMARSLTAGGSDAETPEAQLLAASAEWSWWHRLFAAVALYEEWVSVWHGGASEKHPMPREGTAFADRDHRELATRAVAALTDVLRVGPPTAASTGAAADTEELCALRRRLVPRLFNMLFELCSETGMFREATHLASLAAEHSECFDRRELMVLLHRLVDAYVCTLPSGSTST
ncbi:hypothetical protein CDCA_CDCA20G4824 [Cyanidium caldarium]|uniref:Nuclear pore complex protein n=1 Tax=Cyanidium caldarium TaxID=2771 RepID=A0AAV9J2T6_CYACA|nr:hypothetical protein CDCA_CDCA20G4824 [Cyanidium caldarium]